MNREFWKGRSVLVTGGTGLLGGWLLKALVEAEAEVVCLVRDHVPRSMAVRERLLDSCNVVSGELEDYNLLRRTLAEYSVNTIFHLGAQTQVVVGQKDPIGTLEANIRGTWNLLEAARHSSSVQQFLFASSDKAYGISDNLPYFETHPLQGVYPYDVSKSCGDLIARMYAVTYGVPVGIVRCGNLFGGGDLNFNRTIPGVIQATLENKPFVIRSDGKFVRDFLYVKDAVEAYLLLAEKLAADRSLIGEPFNFSLEIHLNVLEITEKVLAYMGRTDLRPVIQNIASGEIREQFMSSEKARRVLGWKPTYALDGGLQETIAWYRDFFAQAEIGELAVAAAGRA